MNELEGMKRTSLVKKIFRVVLIGGVRPHEIEGVYVLIRSCVETKCVI